MTTSWEWSWRRPLYRARELSELEQIILSCEGITLDGSEDKWVWRLDNSGRFTNVSLRTAIDDMILCKTGTTTRWNKLVPSKVRIHFWRTRLDRLPTRANLSEKGIILDSDLCPLCKMHRETGEHLFVVCNKTAEVRRVVNRWMDCLPENYTEFMDVLRADINLNQSGISTLIRDAITQAYCWVIWKGRNDVVFNRGVFNPLIVANNIQSIVFSWFCNRSSFGKNLSWQDWICNTRSL